MNGSRRRLPTTIAGPTSTGELAATTPPVDPRALRVGVAPATRLEGDPAFDLAPSSAAPSGDGLLVDGEAIRAHLHRFDAVRARLEQDGSDGMYSTDVRFGPVVVDRRRGTEVREVVVGGWRIEVEIETERRAVLRERARRGAGAASKGGPVEVRAIIPGRVVAVSVLPGDDVVAGQQILVVEAMKMQNELRAPREGTVERVGVAVGDTIDVGDLLVLIH